MIITDRTITVRKGVSNINEPVVVYRGDYEIVLRFTIMNSKFKFMSGTNMIESEKASYAQLAILTPYGGNIFSAMTRCSEGAVAFVMTQEMLDQIEEVGLYSFQIRLFDANKESRITIPPVEFGIEIREPIVSEDHDNTVNLAVTGYAAVRKSDPVGYPIEDIINPNEENVGPTFDDNGDYNKTEWSTGNRISQGKLNKIEDALYTINQNEKSDIAALGKRVTTNYNVLRTEIDNLVLESGTSDMEVVQARGGEATLNDRLNKMDDVSEELGSQLVKADVKFDEKLSRHAIIIQPGDGWEDELMNSFRSNTHIKLLGNFETESAFEFINMFDSKIEVVGEIKVISNGNKNRQLFIFTECSNLELILNIDCNKNETVSTAYFPMVHCVNCKNITITKSNLKNAPHTALEFVNSKNCIIKDSNFINFYDSGLNIGEGSINCIAKNNNFSCPDGLMNYGSHALNIYSRGIHTFGHLISGNNFYDIQSSAIQLTGRINAEGVELMDVTDCIIENNIVNFFGHNGVKLDGTGKNITINNNIFKNANVRPDGTTLDHECYGIFTSGQAGRAYSLDAEGNFFENAGTYALRFNTADTGDIMGYVNFKNNICVNSTIYISVTSKVETVDIIGNRISKGVVLVSNGLSGTLNIKNVNITHNILDGYNENGYAMYFVNNGCLRFSNNTLICSNASKNPPYMGYLASTNMIIENNNVINNGSSDARIRTVSGVIETCIFNGNINMAIYNENDISASYIKDYIKIK